MGISGGIDRPVASWSLFRLSAGVNLSCCWGWVTSCTIHVYHFAMRQSEHGERFSVVISSVVLLFSVIFSLKYLKNV